MARVPLIEATKPQEKKEYFNSQYSLSKVVGQMAVGKEICVVPIGLENGVYRTMIHKVKAKGERNGFKGYYDSNIICKSVDPLTGEKTEEALCCQLAAQQKEQFPTKEESSKRLISFATSLVHIPVMVLPVANADKLGGKSPIELLQADSVLFSYLELAGSTFESEIVGRLRTKLEEDGLINYEMSEDEANAVVSKWLCNVIIKIKCVASAKGFKYEREYTFAPFYNKQIGARTGQREAIIHYRKNAELMNQVNSFLTLFDSKQEELINTWSEEELQNYVVNSVKRDENIQHAIDVDAKLAMPKAQQVVEFTQPVATVTVAEPQVAIESIEQPVSDFESDIDFDFDTPSLATQSAPVAEETQIELSEEDTSFDLDTDDSFFDDIAGID